MLISVIIPTHNAEKTIARCIESVLKQKEVELEVIIGDDCSTDNTMSVLKRYAELNENVFYFQNEKNMRAAYTRNECIKRARGELIAQIDDDDYMAEGRLAKQMHFLLTNKNYSFVGSNMFYFDEEGVWKESRSIEFPEKEDFLSTSAFSNPSVMFWKKCLDSVGGYRVAKETIRGQDYDLFMRLYAAGFKGANIQESLTYYYRGKVGYQKTTVKIRYYDFLVRWRNFKKLGLMPAGILYAIKPLLLMIIPFRVLEKIKRVVH